MDRVGERTPALEITMVATVVLRESWLITALLSAFVMGLGLGYRIGYGNGRLDEMTKK